MEQGDAPRKPSRPLVAVSRRSYPTVEDVRNVIRLLGLTNEKSRKLKAEDLVDDRFVRKLEKEGRF
ncbi:MAG: hypothetical protein Q8S00_02080 [Deltaproteobacteria bacterium]|nr:hypothetical protein [Deltaproteobacteria bacterium]